MARFGSALMMAILAGTLLAQTPRTAVPAVKTWQPERFQKMHEGFVERARQGNVGVVFLGDSITEGWAYGEQKQIWDRTFGKYSPVNFGISGDKTEHVLWRIENGELDGIQPKALVLMIGTNNIGSDSTDDIRTGVTRIVQLIRQKLPGTRVLLLGVFPRGANATDPVRETVRTINQGLAKLDDGSNVRYLDIGDRFLAADASITKEMMPDALHLSARAYGLWAAAVEPLLQQMVGVGKTVHPDIWPAVKSRVPRDPKIETAVDALMAKMTLEEKVAQLMQPAVHSVKPEDMKQYHFGSVLNGGGGFPGDIRAVTRHDWLALADKFYEASMDTSGGKNAIPVIWGSDAVHGHTNVVGATIFPHNIGLGATRNAELIRRIGEITATEMAITGIDWDFSPVVAVARDDRWGRTYESYSEDPALVKTMAGKMVEGIQNGRHRIVATAKHFLGDGGSASGKDGGDTQISETDLRDIHGPGYVSAIQAGVMTVMISQSAWNGREMHGNGELMTDVLKKRMGFDGFIIGDWNGHAQVPWCTNANCPASLNAGLDMYMVPDDWKALYENTLAQVRSGAIPQARVDDAVRRILRVKMRAGLFAAGKPSERPAAKQGDKFGSREHRAVARQAVRESLVLLKNNGGVLPVKARSNVLVAGDGAHNLAKQSGGWTISWQGDGNSNKDFPGATSIWSGVRMVVDAAGGNAQLSPDGSFQEKPDVAIVVYGENPYAEWEGDRKHIIYENETDLALLRRLNDAGIPVVSVFLSGRPMWVNPFLNASDAFVAAWLPGSEGHGVADVLFGKQDFKGKLSFSWPRSPAQVGLNRGAAIYDPLFAYGFGLTYKQTVKLPDLPEDRGGVDTKRRDVFFQAGPEAPWELGSDATVEVRPDPGERRKVIWSGKGGDVYLRGGQPVDLSRDGQTHALAIAFMVESAPTAPVALRIGNGAVDIASLLHALPAGEWKTIRVPLRCFAAAGADLSRVDTPFRIGTSGALGIRFADIELVPAGAGICPPAVR
jgi:beta-glucosidase